MCGIVGLIAKNNEGYAFSHYIQAAAASLKSRGPDAQNFFSDNFVTLGHCRLSIIDLSEAANQPQYDVSGRYAIIYNGEIFNYRELRKQLEESAVDFRTHSDTEVLLQLYIRYGKEMLKQLNGFFAFAIYDREEKSVFIVRDRFGVKPLFFYEDENCLLFASEMKALLQFPIVREIDRVSLHQYLQLNYIPAPDTIFSGIKKLLPGHFIIYENNCATIQEYYEIPDSEKNSSFEKSYDAKQHELVALLNDSVQKRLISDVPLGAFLSGGIDSSIICGLASKYTDKLKTFSIGYKEDGFFDETRYAGLVAKLFKTDHTVFTLSRSDLLESLSSVLDYLDEPFADSSALPVFILSKFTRQHVKVALSGDGADELFGGYAKHLGEYRARHPQFTERMMVSINPLMKLFPQSRNNEWMNRLRQLQKFSGGMKLGERERYWRWCCISGEEETSKLLLNGYDEKEFLHRKNELLRFIHQGGSMNEVFLSDVSMVLPNDMLTKVDSMSMANSLEVRTPFLDYRIVEFAFSIPASFKVDRHQRKKIVHDAFRNFLPPELYHRPKKGFEIPLHSFLTNELKSVVEGEFFSEEFIRTQNIFNYAAVAQLREQLFSPSPHDSAARMWGLLVFQFWWKKWMG